MKFRTGLLLGAAFIAGVAVGPTSSVLERQFGLTIFPMAWAQDNSHADAYRLLSLFGDVFERVRAEYVDPVKDQDLVENAINGMLTGLDPHSSYMNAEAFRDMQVTTSGQFGGLGIEVQADNGFIRVISPIDDTPASRAGVKAGDLILSLDGQSVQGMALKDAVDKMRGAPNSKIVLTIKRDGVDKPMDIAMQREVIHIQVVKSRLVDNDLAYIRVTTFSDNTDSSLHQAFADLQKQSGNKLKGLVLDLRNNPGGLLDQGVDVADDFIAQGEVLSTRARHPEDSQRWDAKGSDITNGLPMVVLINGGTASAAEIVSGALKDNHRALIMGRRTFGKGVVQTVLPLDAEHAVKITTARYYTPSGTSIQAEGIKPDIALADLAVNKADSPPSLIGSEADLPNHLANEDGKAGDDIDNDGSNDNAKLATQDYALSQALNVLKGLALGKRTPSSAR